MSDTCFHCGLPLAGSHYTIRYQQRDEPACCAGCAAVAQAIIDNGMGDYYAQRTAPADRADALPPELLEQLRLFDDPIVQTSFVRIENPDSDIREAALILEGITCAACVWLNETHLRRLPGVLSVDIHYTSHRARIQWDNSKITLSGILEAITAIGYRAHPFDADRQQSLFEARRKRAIRGLWIAGFSMMQVMMFAIPVYMANGDMSADIETLIRWSSLLITLPAVIYSAQPFFKGAWQDLKRKQAGMDTPVSLGILLAFGASCWGTVYQNGDVYFDSVTMFIFLLLGGRYLEERARRQAGSAAEALVQLLPRFAHVVTDWPVSRDTHEAPVARLQVGECVSVRPGESFPVDGVVVDGSSQANEALLTGESRPLRKTIADPVIAGSLNLESPLIIQATATGANTAISEWVRLLDRALNDKPRIAQIADRWAGYFVILILILAALTFAAWWQIDSHRALWITVAVLVATCPCALSLATPAALAAATGHLSRQGLLLGRGQALDALPRVTDIVFDKTGTLTYGNLQLKTTHTLSSVNQAQAISLAAALESGSEHPIAKALRNGEPSTAMVDNLQATPGEGICGWIDGKPYYLGRYEYVARFAPSPTPEIATTQSTRVWLGNDQHWIAAFDLDDEVRPETPALIQNLQQRGYKVHLLSGDHPPLVAFLAQKLHISSYRGAQTPVDKLAYLKGLQAQGKIVLMIGDGVNDAPVLAAANVSLAVSGGAEVAQHAADIVLMGTPLTAVTQLIQTAKRSQIIIRQNLAWAAAYNLVILPLAMLGWLNPWQSGLGMALSSLLVVSNALRLMR